MTRAQTFAVAFSVLVLIGVVLKQHNDIYKLQQTVADKDKINTDLARHMVLSVCTTMSARRVLEIVDRYREFPHLIKGSLEAERRSYNECRDI